MEWREPWPLRSIHSTAAPPQVTATLSTDTGDWINKSLIWCLNILGRAAKSAHCVHWDRNKLSKWTHLEKEKSDGWCWCGKGGRNKMAETQILAFCSFRWWGGCRLTTLKRKVRFPWRTFLWCCAVSTDLTDNGDWTRTIHLFGTLQVQQTDEIYPLRFPFWSSWSGFDL